MVFKIKSRTYAKHNFPLIVGVLNLTPDSFYDGGKYNTIDKILKKVEKMVKEGADILDIGGESTRPFSKRISSSLEIKRLLSPLKKIKKNFDIPISVDTMKSEVAEVCLSEGAEIINDATGLMFDQKIAKVVARYNAALIINHTPDMPERMQEKPYYLNITEEIKSFFHKNIIFSLKAGISKESIVLDPGIGFGKNLTHNIELIKNIKEFKKLKLPLMYGVSNKTFIGEITKVKNPRKRIIGSIVTANICIRNGVEMIRVHNVKETKQMISIWSELE
jgi:dihydropteroate synthase